MQGVVMKSIRYVGATLVVLFIGAVAVVTIEEWQNLDDAQDPYAGGMANAKGPRADGRGGW
jgi:L-asparagine transporter-like permease